MTSPPAWPRVGPPWWAVASSLGAVVALLGGWLVAEAVQRPGSYDPVRDTISALARHGADHRWIMTAGLYGIGLCHLITAAGLRGLRPWSRALLALGGAAGVGIAACAQPDIGSTNSHLAFTTLGLSTLALWPLTVVSRDATRFPLRPRDAVVSGLLSLLLLGWLVLSLSGATLGVAERAATFQQEVWPLLVVLALRRSAGDATRAAPPSDTGATRVDRMAG